MKVKSESEVAQSYPTLSDPMDCSPLGSSVYGIFQARVPGVGCHHQTTGLKSPRLLLPPCVTLENLPNRPLPQSPHL